MVENYFKVNISSAVLHSPIFIFKRLVTVKRNPYNCDHHTYVHQELECRKGGCRGQKKKQLHAIKVASILKYALTIESNNMFWYTILSSLISNNKIPRFLFKILLDCSSFAFINFDLMKSQLHRFVTMMKNDSIHQRCQTHTFYALMLRLH